MYRYLVFVILSSFTTSYGLYGEKCVKDGIDGKCINIRQCQSAEEDLRNKKYPMLCGFEGTDPVVCCVDYVSTPPATISSRPVATVPPMTTKSTTEYIPEIYDYITSDNVKEECGPVPPNLTSLKTGQKAWDKCIEYQEQLVYPCQETADFGGGKIRVNRCTHVADELIVGGTDAALGEFPHMALLGYGDNSSTAQWLCGGTLISDRFILTAGHCTFTREYGNITFAILGILKRSQKVPDSKIYKIKRIINHPEYKLSSKYNDIALLETETPIHLDQFTVPACLDVGKQTNYRRAIATGWGMLAIVGDMADNLQKVTLTKFNDSECSEKFPPMFRLEHGLDIKTQICYGDHTDSKDACQGDSSGPLQMKTSNISCMYTVIGVTSFGRMCGIADVPGIYTRVDAFVPWIESVVWP